MPRPNRPPSWLPSLVDRLIDPEAQGTNEQPWYDGASMIAAINRDLNDLLNTRQTQGNTLQDHEALQRSILAYGMPDVTGLDAATMHQRSQIGQVIEDVIRQFEPRLTDVRAVLLDQRNKNDRSVRFRIDARLRVASAPEVAFETSLEPKTGRYQVEVIDR